MNVLQIPFDAISIRVATYFSPGRPRRVSFHDSDHQQPSVHRDLSVRQNDAHVALGNETSDMRYGVSLSITSEWRPVDERSFFPAVEEDVCGFVVRGRLPENMWKDAWMIVRYIIRTTARQHTNSATRLCQHISLKLCISTGERIYPSRAFGLCAYRR